MGGGPSVGGPYGGRHGGGLPSRGSSPALPTLNRDTAGSDVGSVAERSGTPGTCTPPEPAATADLERFILQVTPMLSLDPSKPLDQALQDLSLDDVWRFYQEPSMYGREVYTLGGVRGPSLCYFVPYLSAIQLFTPASPKDGPGTSRMYVSDTEGWPKHMHLKFEHFEHEMPFNRTPLYEHIEQLAEASSRAAAATATATPAPSAGKASPAASLVDEGDAAAAAAAAAGDGVVSSASQSGGNVGTSGPGAASQPGSASSSPSASAALPAPLSGVAAAPAVPQRRASAPGTAALPSSSSSPSDPPAAAAAAALGSPPGPAVAPQLHNSFLRSARVSELHPASWFSVAWYPVYRIPDAPLCARFLTFHSFAPLVISMQRAHAALVDEGLHRPVAIMPLQVVGLKWYNMHGERWLEALSDPAVGAAGSSNLQPGSAQRRQQDGGWQDGGSTPGSSGGRPRRQPPQPPVDLAWQAHLSELQSTAERLARGYGLRVLGQMGAEDVRLRHPDYEFFNNRG